jgi:hypothetical protein
LNISATDNVGVTQMYVQEWGWAADPVPHWAVIESSGWVPYHEAYPWTLTPQSGVHFVGVWVTDEAGNVSHLTISAVDYASLLLPDDVVNEGDLVPYLAYYGAGEDVIATLETVSGDADLYVWFPSNLGLPDAYSIEPDTELDQVTFTAPEAGTYLFLVYGYEASTYDLSISPAGGPRAWTAAGDPGGQARAAQLTFGEAGTDGEKVPQFYTEPILSFSGLDPLGQAESPARFFVYLPLVLH